MAAIFGESEGARSRGGAPAGASPLAPRSRPGFGGAIAVGVMIVAAGAAVLGLSHRREATPPAPPSVTHVALSPPRAVPPPPAPTPAVVPAAPVPVREEPVVRTAAKRVRASHEAVRAKPRPERTAKRDDQPADKASGPCRHRSPDARYACTLDALAAADGRLRRAYDTAVVTGVPRRQLLSTRERWNTLRRTAREQPFHVIERYQALAAELEAVSTRAQ